MRTLLWLLALALPLGLTVAARAADDEATRTLEAFQAYLKKQYPDKKWQVGPTRLDCPPVRAAYGQQRFYYVFSAPPLPPGANLPSLQEAYRRRVEEFRKDYISLTARVDEAGTVTPLTRAEDYNQGLMKVQSDDDARTAAAAILSLYGSDRVGPGAVDPKGVSVTKGDKGWSCRVQTRFYQGTVDFNADGKCLAVSKTYTGPLPQ
jgi:hypothetical protein